MNSISIIGNLGRDPQLNAAGNMAYFSIAVKQSFKDQSGDYPTHWFDCKAFGKTAELIANNFSKGQKIPITGHLNQNKYEKDGQTISKTEIYVDSITFISSKSDTSECYDNGQVNTQQNNSNHSNGQNGGNKSNVNQNDPFMSSGESIDIEDDDLPF